MFTKKIRRLWSFQPAKLTFWSRKIEVWLRWCSFSIWWILSFMLVFRISWSFHMIWQYQPLESNPLPRIGQGSSDDPNWRNETMLHFYSIFLDVLHVAKRIVWVGNFQIHLSPWNSNHHYDWSTTPSPLDVPLPQTKGFMIRAHYLLVSLKKGGY